MSYDTMNEVNAFIKRFNQAKAIRTQWESHLTDVYDLFLPNRNNFYDKTQGQKTAIKLFDDTGTQALQQFVN